MSLEGLNQVLHTAVTKLLQAIAPVKYLTKLCDIALAVIEQCCRRISVRMKMLNQVLHTAVTKLFQQM